PVPAWRNRCEKRTESQGRAEFPVTGRDTKAVPRLQSADCRVSPDPSALVRKPGIHPNGIHEPIGSVWRRESHQWKCLTVPLRRTAVYDAHGMGEGCLRTT